MRPLRGARRSLTGRRPTCRRAWWLGTLIVAGVVAQGIAAPARPKRTPLQRQIDAVLTDPALKGARIGCRVLDCASGKVLYSYHAAEPLTPASNVKLATTAAALELLGADYRFVTRLGLVGRDLVVIGAGDPNISGRFTGGRITAVFEAWARRLKARGITVIEGDLVGDDTLFDREYRHPTWPRAQLSSWYCAPVGALSLNDNCVDVWVRPGARVGRRAVVRLDPPGGHLTLVNRAVTIAGRRGLPPFPAALSRRPIAISAHRPAGTTTITVTGRLRLGSRPVRRYVTVRDPGLFFLASLRHVLGRHGITVKGRCLPASAPTDMTAFRPLAEYTSTLERTIKVTNTRSQNFYAESLVKLVGVKSSGAPGRFATGTAAVRRFLGRAGVGDATCVLADGSGLSRRNRLSAMHLTNLLRHMAGRPTGALYRRSLATSGVDGGLRHRCAEAPFRGRVHAKTGTLNGVSALSGYADTLDGRTLVFSILITRHRCSAAQARRLQDDLCRILVRSSA